MLPILVPSSAKCTAKDILVIAKLNKRKKKLERLCDIMRPSEKLPVQS